MEDETLKVPPAGGKADDDRTLVAPEPPARAANAATTDAAVEAEAPRLTPGAILADRYRIVTRLGKGGMGEVYRADDLRLEVPVALKFLPPSKAADGDMRAQLFAEVKVARKISHPNACRVYDLGEADGVLFLSMEYIDGEDLKSLLRRIGRPTWEKSIELGRQVSAGLEAAHEAGVLHRDLKPANLMIDGEGRARITDFGLAALADSLIGSAGAVTGTPLYMAPEQFAGRAATVQSDLYSLGLLLYELLTGEKAFEASSFAEARRLHQQGIPTPPSKLRFGFDPAIEEIILRCLEKDPADRPRAVTEVSAALAGGAGVGFSEGAQIATLVATGLVAGPQLVESLGDSTSGELFGVHDRMTRDLVDEHGGREIEKADGFLILFQRPLEALRFALAYHRRLDELATERGMDLSARVGIHLGEVVVRHNSPRDVEKGAKPVEVEGFARPMTRHLNSLAAPRQTLLTQGAFDVARRSARGELGEADALRWLAHGEYRFAAADEPVAVFEVGLAGVAPLTAPEGTADARRVAGEDTVLGWRPAPGLEVPQRPSWVVQKKLGEGGFGEAWLVAHAKSGESRVYKFCYEKEQLSSLQREITVFRLLKEELGLRDDIARILDWDLDEAPYFLEFAYYEGGSLIDWAQTRGGIDRVPLGERLELVAQAATALAAAHSVGVLHKDVKPGNVLIEESAEGTPRAILTDFGIGLITDQERLAARGITVLGMTQMESEIAGHSATGTQLYLAPELQAGQPATMQADLYALGIMLYQMTVGDLARPLAQGWKRQVADELLRKDIAALVDGNPERRPASAAEVASRIRSLEERRAERQAEEKKRLDAEKAQRRRKVLSVAASISTVFLVVVSLLAIQAIRARADAERRRAQAESLIDFMLTDLHEGLDRIGRLDLLEGVARSSQAHFESLSGRDESSEALYQRGITLQNIGQVLLEQGDADAARASQEAALAIFEAGVESRPVDPEWRRGLSLGRLSLGTALREQGDTEGALAFYRAALETAEQLAAEKPGDRERLFAVARSHYEIAFLQRQIGDRDACLEQAAAALALLEPLTAKADADWRHHLLLLETHKLLGRVHRFNNSLAAAMGEAKRVREFAGRLQIDDPGNAYWPRLLAWSHSEIGLLLSMQGDLEGAFESAREAIAAYRILIVTDPTRVLWREFLAFSLQLNGYVFALMDRPAPALELYAEANAILQEIVESDPARVQWLRQLAYSHQVIGQLHQSQGRTAAAIESLSATTELFLDIVALSGDDPGPRNEVAWNRVLVGDAYADARQIELAREQWTLAVEEIEPISTTSQNDQFLDTHVQALLRLGRVEESRTLVEKLLASGFDGPGFRDLVRSSGLDVDVP